MSSTGRQSETLSRPSDREIAPEIVKFPGGEMRPEFALLLTACGFAPDAGNNEAARVNFLRWHLRQLLDWEVVLRLADQHGVAPLLYQSLTRVVDAVPAFALQSLELAHQGNVHKALFLSRELVRLLDCLESRSIEVMPYKGVVVAETLYGDTALRSCGDIDVLVREADLPRITGAVRELGYTSSIKFSERQERAYLKSGYERSFDGPAGRNLLELQWAPQPRFYSVAFDMNELFGRAVEVTVAGRTMKTLAPEDLLLVLTAHAAKHVWGRLIWVCDIARIVGRNGDLNWDLIQERARELGIERMLRVTLLLASPMLGVELPVALRRDLLADTAAQSLAKEIGEGIALGVTHPVESAGYFRLMMRLRERRRDRMRFLNRLIFTPGPGEWSAIQLPAPLFPLYRVVRLSRLAARFVRGIS